VARRRRAERFYACGALERSRTARSTRTLDVMRTLVIVALAFALSACGNCVDQSMPSEGFAASRIEDGRGLAVTMPNGQGSVHIDRYPTAPGGPLVGTAVTTSGPAATPQTLEALDPDGDGHWDSVRYMVNRNGELHWVEDNDADGIIDSVTSAKEPDEIILH